MVFSKQGASTTFCLTLKIVTFTIFFPSLFTKKKFIATWWFVTGLKITMALLLHLELKWGFTFQRLETTLLVHQYNSFLICYPILPLQDRVHAFVALISFSYKLYLNVVTNEKTNLQFSFPLFILHFYKKKCPTRQWHMCTVTPLLTGVDKFSSELSWNWCSAFAFYRCNCSCSCNICVIKSTHLKKTMIYFIFDLACV